MNSATYPAAQFCEGLSIGGYTDWYMPAINEVQVFYYNLKPGTASNTTGDGTNANSVPRRNSNYTAGDPAQTSAAIFQTGGSEAFNVGGQASSTQYVGNSSAMAYVNFYNGNYGGALKTSVYSVRAARRIAV
jgi:hypothetical protein